MKGMIKMKKTYKFIALFATIILSVSVISACTSNNKTSEKSKSDNDSPNTYNSIIDENKLGNKNSQDNKEENVSPVENSQQNTTEENSKQSSEEINSSEPSNENDNPASESSEVSENTDNSSEESDGYYFDDEQIVDDYHTATVFTNNEEFNAIFSEMSINKDFESELKEAETVKDMREVTIKYATKWQNEVSKVYDSLYSILNENDTAKTALKDSQSNWNNSLTEIKEQFYTEASEDGAGSEKLLSADMAMMNYYKGRAAVLYEQIYKLTGSLDL